MSPITHYPTVANATNQWLTLPSNPVTGSFVSSTHSPVPSSIWSRLTRFDPMNDYLILSQNLFLIVSNFFMLPAIYLAIRFKFRGEAIVFTLTMLASSFYHLCDNNQVKFCVANYESLQFLDFYCAIMTLWVTSIILANVPVKWISSYQLGGSAFFAFLLRNNTVGALTFIVPAFCSISLLAVYWGYRYYSERQLPSIIHTKYFIVASIFTVVGILLFAIQQRDGIIGFYGFTHSAWHVCTALSITFLLPNRNRIPLFYYRGKRYSLDDNITEQIEAPSKQEVEHEHGARENLAFGEDDSISRIERICHHI